MPTVQPLTVVDGRLQGMQSNDVLRLHGIMNIGATETYVISGGIITLNGMNVALTSESGTTDDLDTIAGAIDGDLIIVRVTAGHTITLKNLTGNLSLGADRAINNNDVMTLVYRGNDSVWILAGLTEIA